MNDKADAEYREHFGPENVCPIVRGPCIGEDCLAYDIQYKVSRFDARAGFENHVCRAMDGLIIRARRVRVSFYAPNGRRLDD